VLNEIAQVAQPMMVVPISAKPDLLACLVRHLLAPN
jgi:hypothetical protein